MTERSRRFERYVWLEWVTGLDVRDREVAATEVATVEASAVEV